MGRISSSGERGQYHSLRRFPMNSITELKGKQVFITGITSPVGAEIARLLIEGGADGFVEIGPGQVLKGLLRQTDRSRECITLGKAEEVQAFKEGM